jgi:periplasmic protein CpxP/Spy
MNHRRLLMLALAPAALALTTFAHAQPTVNREVRVIHAGPGGHGGPEMKALHEAMMKQHVEDLKTVLRLRSDQEAALQAFVATHHAGPGGHGMHGGGPVIIRRGGPDGPGGPAKLEPPKPMTTPERLDQMAKHHAAMAAEHEKSRAALAKFYAALSPDQQKVFDALQRLQGPGRHGGMMGGPGMRRIEIRRGGPGGGPTPGHEPD